MKFSQEVEIKLRKKSLEYMEKSRPDWGISHVCTAVFYMKKLLEKEGGNTRILLPAIYFHDIGYAGLLKKGYTHEQNHLAKKDHMVKGSNMSKKILKKIGGFSNEEINKISVLISIHDNLEEIKGHSAQLVFEADSLAQIDVIKMKPSYAKEDYVKFINRFKKRRAPLFKTKTGKSFLKKLLPRAEQYFD